MAERGPSGGGEMPVQELPVIQSWPQESEQSDKWSFCLTAGKIGPRIRRDDEQTSTPEPHTGFQGEGGASRRQGRSNTISTVGAVRRASQSDHLVEGAAGGRTGYGIRNITATETEGIVDVKSLHAKIGELTLENDFLEGALTKAGLLSAKR